MTEPTLLAEAATPPARHRPRISVVMPAWNTPAPYFEAAVASVLTQAARGGVELILVDDASDRPETLGMMARWETHPQVRVVRNPERRGVSFARNAGIEVASGDWITFCDSDDEFAPGWLDHLSDLIARHPDAAWIGGRYATRDPEGQVSPLPSASGSLGLAFDGEGLCELGGASLTRLLIGRLVCHIGATAVRRDVLGGAIRFDERFSHFEDRLFLITLSLDRRMLETARTAYLYNIRPRSAVNSAATLSPRILDALRFAHRSPTFARHRRALRWAMYTALKDLAASNLLYGKTSTALACAFRAFALDPREIRDIARFLRAVLSDESRRMAVLGRYSSSKLERPAAARESPG